MNLRTGTQPVWRSAGSPTRDCRRWLKCLAALIALSLALISPLACIIHCLATVPAPEAGHPAAFGLEQFICQMRPLTHPDARQAAPRPAPEPPPALYPLAPPLHQGRLVIVLLVLALLARATRLLSQHKAAPPTPPPRRLRADMIPTPFAIFAALMPSSLG